MEEPWPVRIQAQNLHTAIKEFKLDSDLIVELKDLMAVPSWPKVVAPHHAAIDKFGFKMCIVKPSLFIYQKEDSSMILNTSTNNFLGAYQSKTVYDRLCARFRELFEITVKKAPKSPTPTSKSSKVNMVSPTIRPSISIKKLSTNTSHLTKSPSHQWRTSIHRFAPTHSMKKIWWSNSQLEKKS